MNAISSYAAILFSAIASLIFSYLWFNQFFKFAFLKDLGKTPAQLEKAPNLIVSSAFQLLGNILLAFVLSWLITQLGYSSLTQTLQLAILVWFGFIIAVIGPLHVIQSSPLRLFLIIAGGSLASILITTVILTLW